MTELRRQGGSPELVPGGEPGGEPPGASLGVRGGARGDPWGRLGAEFRRRRSLRWVAGCVLLAYGLAAFAPLIASDRPYYVRAVDVGAYRNARHALARVLAGFLGRAETGRAAWEAGLAPEAPIRDWSEALELELQAVSLRLDTLRRYTRPELHGALARLELELDHVLRSAEAGRGPVPPAETAKARNLAAEIRAQFRPQVAPGTPGVELVPQTSYPLFAQLSALDVALMALWCVVALTAVSTALRHKARAQVRARRVVAAWLLVAFAAGLAWQASGMRSRAPGREVKPALSIGTMTVERALFPPLGFGFDESHMNEALRPPTWLAVSEISEEGRYLRGPRAPSTDPDAISLPGLPVDVRFAEPGRNSPWRHPLGTDSLGRDVLVRMLHGARISLSVGLIAALLLTALGTFVGAIAGYFGGLVDAAALRTIEVLQAFPTFLLVLTTLALLPDGWVHPMIVVAAVIALLGWTSVARLVRAEVRRVRGAEFVDAARMIGLSSRRILTRHVVPQVLGPVWVAAAFAVGTGILMESAVSFLGFGVRYPTPSWGALISETRSLEHWWIHFFPGCAIFATVFAFNWLGDGVRDALDPRGGRAHE